MFRLDWTSPAGTAESRAGFARLWLRGEVDLAAAVELEDGVSVVTRGQPPFVFVDVSQVTFMDASGLGIIARILNQAPDALVYLIGAPRAVTLLLGICGLDRLDRLVLRPSSEHGVDLSQSLDGELLRLSNS
ncbi:MAG TPA: STAS domain-containing protein [Actinomycetes bacterium]|nr:STAS domain-containing protein [Actinomycetes bacterium]